MMRFRITGTALVAATVLSSPALLAAFVEHTLDLRTALIRFVIALAFAVVGLTVIESIVAAYRTSNADKDHQSPASDRRQSAWSADRRKPAQAGAQTRRDDPGFDPVVGDAR